MMGMACCLVDDVDDDVMLLVVGWQPIQMSSK